MNLSQMLGSGIDPALLAQLGATGGPASDFTDMLMKSINPNPGGTLRSTLGSPSLDALTALSANPPPIQRADPTPQLPPAQTLESMGFGMASAAAQPGQNALSALGAGGNQMLDMGGKASERAIQETEAANREAIQEWQNKGALAEKGLDAQMKEPELDARQMDLAGNMALREQAQQEQALYRAGRLKDMGTQRDIQQQNADTNSQKADILSGKADIYGRAVDARIANSGQLTQLKQRQLEQEAAKAATEIETRIAISKANVDERQKSAILHSVTSTLNDLTLSGQPITPAARQAAVDQAFSLMGGGPKPQAEAAPAAGDHAALIAMANEAIAQGKDPEKVKAILRAKGVSI